MEREQFPNNFWSYKIYEEALVYNNIVHTPFNNVANNSVPA